MRLKSVLGVCKLLWTALQRVVGPAGPQPIGPGAGDKTSADCSLALGTTLVGCVTKPNRIPPNPVTG